MKDQTRFLELCSHIVEWGERIPRLIGSRSFEEFSNDETVHLAVWKCVEVLGEASAGILRLDPQANEQYPQLQLRGAYAMRNQLSHGYHSVSLSILWTTVHDFVPTMVEGARKVLEDASVQ